MGENDSASVIFLGVRFMNLTYLGHIKDFNIVLDLQAIISEDTVTESFDGIEFMTRNLRLLCSCHEAC